MGVNSITCPLLNNCTAPDTNTPLSETCKAPAMLEAFIAMLANSVTTVFAGTFVAPLPGRIAITVGAVPDGAVVRVNWLLVGVSALPEKSWIAPVSVTVRVAPDGNWPTPGLSTTVRLSRETEIDGFSGTSPFHIFTELELIVVGLMDFENVSTTCVFNPTLVAPLDGVMVTVGAVWSTVFAVVNEYPN